MAIPMKPYHESTIDTKIPREQSLLLVLFDILHALFWPLVVSEPGYKHYILVYTFN